MEQIYAVDSTGLLIVAALIVLLFGSSQLPKLARGLGQAKGEFENAQKPEKKDATKQDEEQPTEPPSDK
jgi:sec-independent protein translocase protein TatA